MPKSTCPRAPSESHNLSAGPSLFNMKEQSFLGISTNTHYFRATISCVPFIPCHAKFMNCTQCLL